MKGTFTALLIALTFFATSQGKAQNPASPPLNPNGSLPERTFEVFWQTFEDHYAFFKLKNIDWKASYKKYRPQITPSTTDDSLFSVLSQMVAPFHDDHVNLIIPGKREFTAEKPSHFLREFPDEALRKAYREMVDKTLISNGFSPLKGAGIVYRSLPLFVYARTKDIAYLRFERSFASPDEDDSVKDALQAGNLLDSVMETFKGVKGLIIDVRNNIGGNDEFAYAVAGRLTSKRIPGHYKQTRAGGYEEFGPKDQWYVEPLGKPFRHPVVVLTNDQTASAGDVFALIMKSFPRVKLIGDNTLGIYSDMYGFELPNKWLVSLSNQRYFTNEGICYEGVGTPVDVKVLNTRKDLNRMSDPVIQAGIKSLGN